MAVLHRFYCTLYMLELKAVVSLCICTTSLEPSLLADAINIEISCTGPHIFLQIDIYDKWSD